MGSQMHPDTAVWDDGLTRTVKHTLAHTEAVNLTPYHRSTLSLVTGIDDILLSIAKVLHRV